MNTKKHWRVNCTTCDTVKDVPCIEYDNFIELKRFICSICFEECFIEAIDLITLKRRTSDETDASS